MQPRPFSPAPPPRRQPVPPVPERRDRVLAAHGDERVDPWYWLADRRDPAVLAHLAAENAYAGAALAPLAGLREALYAEMVARIKETDLSVPVRRGPWWYYQRTEEGRSYARHCRRPASGEDPPLDPAPAGEEVLLDENDLAEGHEYLQVGNLAVSPDHRWLAYAADTTGAELFDLSFRRLGRDVIAGDGAAEVPAGAPETVPATYYGLAWAADSATVFYTRVDAAMRPYQVWRHRLGTDPARDVLVLDEPDQHFNVSVGRTKDGAFVVIALQSHTTAEAWVVPADQPDTAPRVIEPRRPGVEYAVEHHRAPRRGDPGSGQPPGDPASRQPPADPGWFVLLTNDDADDFRVLAAPAAPIATPEGSCARRRWHEIVPHRQGTRLEDVDVFDDFLVLAERTDGEPQLRVLPVPPGDGIADLVARAGPVASGGVGSDAAGAGTGPETPGELSASWVVPAGEHPSATWEGPNPEPDATLLRVEQTSLVTPRTVLDVDTVTRTARLRKRQPVLGGYDPAGFRTFRLWAQAADGVMVPLSVVRRADLTSPAPCLLYGYGAYEHSVDPVFSSLRLSLLERGVVFAVAHVRGGGELGRRWYTDGKAAAKHHTFSDFVTCARHLLDAGIAAPGRLAARGGSAGGLLMGAVVNQAPELFCAVVAEVPFVDCLTSMLDDSLPLTVGEWEEWGDPVTDPAAYAAIKAYSPYDNVRSHHEDGSPVRHPRILATAGLHDPRVGYWEPAKWVARLRTADPDAEVVLRTELGAGHGGPSGRYDAWRDEALVTAFVLDAVGAGPPAPATAPT